MLRIPTGGRRLGLTLAVALAAAVAAVTQAAAEHWAPPTTVFVPATGHTADGLFLDLWREDGDLTGDPITEEISPRASFSRGAADAEVVQFYENVALLYTPAAPDGEPVRLLDLGRMHLAALMSDVPTATLRDAITRTVCRPNAEDCALVRETGHTVRGAVLAYWRNVGGTDWLGNPLTEAFRAPGGQYVQLFEFGGVVIGRDGAVRPLPLGRIVTKRLGLDTNPIVRPAGVPEYDAALFVAPPEPEPPDEPFAVYSHGPGPQVGVGKELVVSIGQQAFWAYEDGEVVRASLVSTGTGVVPEAETPVGSFQILTKYELQDMEGNVGGYYLVEDVPDVMYFDNDGNAFHGAYWHSNFGTRQSRGCVNLPLDVAAWLYDWTPIGTPVTVLP